MCIRDRGRPADRPGGPGARGFSGVPARPAGGLHRRPRHHGPVSYTHLDVYKRQLPHRPAAGDHRGRAAGRARVGRCAHRRRKRRRRNRRQRGVKRDDRDSDGPAVNGGASGGKPSSSCRAVWENAAHDRTLPAHRHARAPLPRRTRGEVGSGMARAGHLHLRPDGHPRPGLLDRHPATDRVRFAAHGARVLVYPCLLYTSRCV